MAQKFAATTALVLCVALLGFGTSQVVAKNANAANPAHGKSNKDCPPGLAKKDPACVPPGLAKKSYRSYEGSRKIGDYEAGDQLPRWYQRIDNTDDYALPEVLDGSDYYIKDDIIYRVSPKTRRVLELFDFVDAVAN